MTRTFVRDSNNNLVAVMEQEDYRRMRDNPEADDLGPIFLFYPDEIMAIESRGREPWITGDYSLMNMLLAGHDVIQGSIGVPFSNGHQLYMDRDTLLSVFKRIGSVAEAIQLFGLCLPVAGDLTVVDGKIVDETGRVIGEVMETPAFA